MLDPSGKAGNVLGGVTENGTGRAEMSKIQGVNLLGLEAAVLWVLDWETETFLSLKNSDFLGATVSVLGVKEVPCFHACTHS